MKTVAGYAQDNIEIASALTAPRNDESIEKLLDVISFIIADEYIEIAKKNPEVFGIASSATFGGEACNDNDTNRR